MKRLIPDTLFIRLFLLLFLILTSSYFIGTTVFSYFENTHLPNQLHEQTRQSRKAFWFVFRLLGALLAAWIAARWLTAPIKRMAQAAKELGNNLDRPPLEENRGPAEVRQAAMVFNQMQARLKQQITERNRFLAAVSHDLRTPLTRLKLRAEKVDKPDLKADIRADIDEMTAMIESTLEYLRGDGHPETSCLLDISALVHSMAEDAEDRNESITVTGDAQPIFAQQLALRRCLNNLLENAIRYGNQASINLDDTGDQLVISINDAGQGISILQTRLFQKPAYRWRRFGTFHCT
jgi:signal transduction histidine kinase